MSYIRELEFTEENYPNAFIDDRIRSGLEYHYCVDTPVILYVIGYRVGFSRVCENLGRSSVEKWCIEHRITLYRPILKELYGCIIKESYKHKRREIYEKFGIRLRRLLNAPNFRFVHVQEPRIKSVDDFLLDSSVREHGKVVTPDVLLSERGFKLGADVYNILMEKLPREYRGDWTELKEESKTRLRF